MLKKNYKHQIAILQFELAFLLGISSIPTSVSRNNNALSSNSYIYFSIKRDITFTSIHLSDRSTLENDIKKILMPYFVNMRMKLKLREDYQALVFLMNQRQNYSIIIITKQLKCFYSTC